ncbi:histidine kinase [Thermoactinospora rubra]|uniref:histidine kinase n=1 Tax=Thermoactinospora rubra TaxID=1088767 RepID=UPI000A118963|nr:histidine kinase [Thermoactinospora rubra]
MVRPPWLRSVRLASLSPLWLGGFTLAAGRLGLVAAVAHASAAYLAAYGTAAPLGGAACLAAVFCLHAMAVLRAIRRRGRVWWPLAGQAVLTVAPWTVLGAAWAPVASLLTASLLVLAERLRTWVPVPPAVACGPLLVLGADPRLWGLALAVPAAGMAEYAVISLTVRAHCLGVLRAEEVRRAAEAERHRLTRDLHDLVGHRLAVLVLKMELAQRLAESGDVKAALELGEALALVRAITGEVRAVARGQVAPSLQDELLSARAILESAGARCHVEVGCGDLPEAVDRVLALVAREGVTNILRHATARECEIRLAESDGVIRLSLANDGVKAGRDGHGRDGHGRDGHGRGLRNLRERITELDGYIETWRSLDGHFHLIACIPQK